MLARTGAPVNRFLESTDAPFLAIFQEVAMHSTDRDTSSGTRSASEIAYVLRRAKWRRGPDVLRDMAKGTPGAENAPAEAPLRRKSARKRGER